MMKEKIVNWVKSCGTGMDWTAHIPAQVGSQDTHHWDFLDFSDIMEV